MDVLSYRDLFDFSDNSEIAKATRAINALEKAYGKFANNMAGEAIRIGQSQGPLLTVLQGLATQLGKVNLANEAGRKNAAKLAADVDSQTRAYNNLKGAQKGVEASNKAVEGSLEALRQKLKEDREELTKLGAAANPERLKELSASIIDTKNRAEVLERAVRGVNSTLTAAKGSYNALTAENRALSVELKNLANTQDRSAQRTKEEIAREQALKIQLANNTAQLKSYDAQLNQHFRNVGNYAASIVEAVKSLQSERTALLAQEAALIQAGRATNLSAEAQNKLQKELDETRAKLQTNVGQLKEYGVGAKSTGESISSAFKAAGAELRSFAVTMAISTFGLTALAAAVAKAFQNNLKYSDSIADIRKTTGLSQKAADEFGESLKKLDTRTDLDELLKIGAIGGQLGIANKELEGFTKSIDTAAVALSDDFAGGAEEVATELGKIDAIFKLSNDVGIAKSITDIGSALNELGASGAATAPFIADYALRVGAVSKNAELGIDRVLGFGAALEELGFTAEVAGTATNKLLSGLSADSSSFFKIAKLADANLSLKEFKSLINNDINAALQLFLKGLNNGGAATTDFAQLVESLGIKGSSTTSVLTALAKNTELVADKQGIANTALREGTSLAKEAEIKLDTLAGSYDRLLNSIKNATTGNGLFAKGLRLVIDGAAAFLDGNFFGFSLKEEKKQFEDFGASAILASRNVLNAARANEELLSTFNGLNNIKGRSAAQDAQLRKTVLALKAALGDSVVVLNKETGQYDLNTGAVNKSIQAKRTEALEGVKQQVKRAKALEIEATTQRALTKAVEEEAANRESVIRASGIAQEKLAEQAAIRAKQRSGKANFSINEYRDTKGVPDSVLDQFEQLSELNKKVAESTKKAGEAEYARAEILKSLEQGQFSLQFQTDLLKEAEKELAEATLDDKDAMKDAAKAAKDYAKAQAELAQSEYELARFRAEQREGKFERQSDNVANGEDFRLEAAEKAAAEQKAIALLDQKEQIRIAKETAKDLVNGDAVLAIKRQLISEQYAARVAEIERDLTKEQLEIHEDAVAALEDIDKFRLETENSNLQRLIADETAGFAIRSEAQKQFARNTILLANLAYNEEIRNAKGNVEKIKLALDKLREATSNAGETAKPFDATLANDELDISQKNALLKLEADRVARANGIVDEKAYQKEKQRLENEYAQAHFTNLNVEKDGTKAALDEELAYRRALNEQEIADEREKTERKLAIAEEAAQLLMNIGGSVNEVYSAQLDNQLAALSKQKDNELEMAGDNAAAKQKIEADYDRQQAKIKRKQAIAAKAAALFEIALQTGIAVAKAVAASPLTFGLPFSAFALANGVVQAAVVLAKPIPAFAKGTEHSPLGPALVGEAGAELLEYNGKMKMVDKPTIVNLKGGTKVYNNRETIKYLAAERMRAAEQSDVTQLQHLTQLLRTVQPRTIPAPPTPAAASFAAVFVPVLPSIAQYEERAMTRNLATAYRRSERVVAPSKVEAFPAKDVAKIIGKEIGAKFESLEDAILKAPKTSVVADKNGLNIYVTEAGRTNEIKRKRYHRA